MSAATITDLVRRADGDVAAKTWSKEVPSYSRQIRVAVLSDFKQQRG
jgi:hypothetical protein